MGSREVSELKQKIYRLKQDTLPPQVGMIVTGSPVLWTSMDENLVHTQRSSIAIVTIVALIVLAVIVMGFGAAAGRDTVKIETYFEDSVQGLESGSKVRNQGVEIGVVDDINFVDAVYGVGEGFFTQTRARGRSRR